MHEASLEHLSKHPHFKALIKKHGPPDFTRSVLIAYWAAYFGDAELALDQLQRIVHGSVDEALLWRPTLGDVRKLSGFKEMVRREGLVDYWREQGWPELCWPTAGDDFECA